MPRKKNVEIIEQPINLSPDVHVLIRAPRDKWPHVAWNGGKLEVSVEGALFNRAAVRERARIIEDLDGGNTNGPDHDTPEIIAMKARLPQNPLSGGGPRRVSRETKPYTTADAFRDVTDDNGKKVFDDEAGEGLTPEALIAAAEAGGGTVV